MQFWNSIANLPVGSLFHTVLVDNMCNAFQDHAFNFCSSVAACLHRVGISMPYDTNRLPLLDVHAVIVALKANLAACNVMKVDASVRQRIPASR